MAHGSSWMAPMAGLSLAATMACSTSPPAPPTTPHFARPSELTSAERAYGLAPRRTNAVTYQPDVILVEQGAAVVRGVSPDGLVWFIDPAAIRESELQTGKVLFVTNRAVGRVLGARRENGALAVVLGPVDLTEVVREAHIAIDQPIDFGQAIPYTTANLPGASIPVAAIAWQRDTSPFVIRRMAAGTDSSEKFRAFPVVGPDGIGVRISTDADGLKLAGEARLYLKAPQLRFNLDIVPPGKVTRADVVLTGAAGLLMQFQSGTDVGSTANVNARKQVTTDFSIPIINESGFPFAVTLRQAFVIRTAFSAKGALKAKADYTFSGELSLGYHEGKFGLGVPGHVAPRHEHLLESVGGVSFGVSGLVLTHENKIIVGIGAFGFATGPYVALDSTVAIYRHSDLDTLAICDGATLNVHLAAGIGYLIPQAITDIINTVLRALNIKPIRGEGGLQMKPMKVFTDFSYRPDSRACRPK